MDTKVSTNFIVWASGSACFYNLATCLLIVCKSSSSNYELNFRWFDTDGGDGWDTWNGWGGYTIYTRLLFYCLYDPSSSLDADYLPWTDSSYSSFIVPIFILDADSFAESNNYSLSS